MSKTELLAQGQIKRQDPQPDPAATVCSRAWVYLSDAFYDDPRVVALSDPAYRLWLRAVGYCARTASGGFVPGDLVSSLAGPHRVGRLVTELLTEMPTYGSLWTRDAARGGYVVVGYRDLAPAEAPPDSDDEEADEPAEELAR